MQLLIFYTGPQDVPLWKLSRFVVVLYITIPPIGDAIKSLSAVVILGGKNALVVLSKCKIEEALGAVVPIPTFPVVPSIAILWLAPSDIEKLSLVLAERLQDFGVPFIRVSVVEFTPFFATSSRRWAPPEYMSVSFETNLESWLINVPPLELTIFKKLILLVPLSNTSLFAKAFSAFRVPL
jgi:hypothetical protein